MEKASTTEPGSAIDATRDRRESKTPAWAAHGPVMVLAAFCVCILLVAATRRGHSVESMDVRTYAQMIRGIADHGLPYWDNGPIERFPELVSPWAVAGRGHVWGIYGPLYPYLAAPLFRLGGLELVSSFTFALLAPLALVTFLLARRVIANPWYATAAGVLVVAATPLTAKALETTAFPLMAILTTLAAYYTVRLIETAPAPNGPKALAFVCGMTWAAAGATHALCYPMAIAGLGIIAVAPDAATGKTTWRSSMARLAPTALGFLAAIVPVACLNHVRFGSWNPISYGPIPWPNINPEIYKMTLVEQVRYSLGAVLFVLAVSIALFLVRKNTGRVIGVLAAAAAIAVLVPALRERFVKYAVVGYAYVFDLSLVDLGPMYTSPPDGLGHFYGGWVAKATLQCTPLLLLAPLALRGAGRRRWATLAILVPCAALYASLILRANLVNVDALGWPWVYIRYTFAALPLLLVASLVVTARVRPKLVDAAFAVVIGAALCAAFMATQNDEPLSKRVMLLAAPLACAVVALLAAARAWNAAGPSRLARAFIALTAGISIGIALGHDLRAGYEGKVGCDTMADRFTKVVPPRFALAGWLGQTDVYLTPSRAQDVQYADFQRLKTWTDVRPLLEHWRAEQRPTYIVWWGDLESPWPDIVLTREAAVRELYRVDFRADLRSTP